MTAAVGLVPLGAGVLTLLVAGSWAGRPRPASLGAPAGLGEPEVPAWFRRLLGALELPVDPVAAWAASLVGGVVLAGWMAVRAPLAAVALAALGAVVPRVGRAVAGRRRGAGPSDGDLLGAVAALQAALVSGASLPHALARAGSRPGPVGRDLREVAASMAAGQVGEQALDGWARRRATTGVPLVVDALAIAEATGADRVRALQAVAETLRDRRARAREVGALAAQARLSAVVLVVLPLVFAVLVAAWDPAVARFTTTTPAGWACVVVGLGLDVAGAWWMSRLIGAVR